MLRVAGTVHSGGRCVGGKQFYFSVNLEMVCLDGWSQMKNNGMTMAQRVLLVSILC